MDIRSIYTPSEWQTTFHNLPHNEALGAGAAGVGKSVCLRMEPLAQIAVEHQRCSDKNHPHAIEWGQSVGWCLYLRRTMPMLEQTIAMSHREIPKIDPGAKFSAATYTWKLSSGYRIQYGHCSEKYDFERYMSLEITMALFDELRQFEKVQYDNIAGRVRTTDPVLSRMLKVRSMSNPTDPDGIKLENPNWVRDYFVEPAPKGKVTLLREVKMGDGTVERWTRIYLPGSLYDNPDKEFARQYELSLRTRPIHIQNALLHGDWYAAPGSYFGEDWDSTVHICRSFSVPTSWRHFRCMDWGFKTEGIVQWWAKDPDGTWFVHRELVFKGRHADWVAKRIVEIETDLGLAKNGKSLITGPADNQLWEERGDRGLSKAQEMQKSGVRWVKANKTPGSHRRNSERLLLLLRSHKQDGTGVPGIVFFEGCRYSIRTIPSIMPDKKEPEVPNRDDPDDHAVDCAKYGAEYAERVGASARSPKEADEESLFGDGEDEEEPDVESRGRFGYGT